MLIGKGFTLNKNRPIESQVQDIELFLNKVSLNLTRISFGDPADGNRGENLDGQWQLFTSHASANTEFSVTHTIGSIPVGYIVCGQDKAGELYQLDDTGTAWTATTVYFKSTGTSVAYEIFLLK